MLLVSALLLALGVVSDGFRMKAEPCAMQEKGECKDVNQQSCTGAFVAGLCSGPSNMKCCVPFKQDKEKTCTQAGNECWLKSRASKCSGTLVAGKCPGSSNVQCCETEDPVKEDPCSTQESGKCLNVEQDTCGGALVAGLCSGPSNIKCCIPFTQEKETTCTRESNECWLKSRASKCSGSLTAGKCPGSTEIQCCEQAALVPTPAPLPIHPGQQTEIVEATSAEISKYSYRSTAAAGKVMKASALGRSILFDLRTLGSKDRLCKRTNGGSCVNRYMDLTTKYVISDAALQRVGYTASGMKIFRSVVMGESGGKGGAVNNWDNQYVSWGLFQAAGNAGTLARMLCHLKSLQLSSSIYNELLVANGIDAEDCPGWASKLRITTPEGAVVSGNTEGSQAMQFNMAQLGTLMVGGQFEELVAGQSDYWRLYFLRAGINNKVKVDGGKRLCELVTSEWGLAVISRLYNWMPGWVVKWTDEFIDANPSFATRSAWRQNELAFIEYWNVKRKEVGRKEYVHGKYPVFPGEALSQLPGSFDAACM